MKFNFLLYIIFLLPGFLRSQLPVPDLPVKSDSLSSYNFPLFRDLDTALKSTYPFIDFSKNNYQFFTKESPTWELLYRNMREMIEHKNRKMNFYHIGGSHIQADIYSHDMRIQLETYWEGVEGERGLIFPFDLAHTNNPSNYDFSSPNRWEGHRSVIHKNRDYGVLGASITCSDSASIILFRYDRTVVKQGFTKLRIFHNKGNFPIELNFGKDEILIIEKRHNPQLGYTDIFFTDQLDTFDVQFSRTINEVFEVEIFGFQLSNADPGISYTAIGINGAGLYTYLDCKNFEEQLSVYPPDFFAFSVGTNDGNVPYDDFSPQLYKSNLEKMMQMVLRANPNCAILLTVPNDAYYRKRYLNKNIARERDVMIELAVQYQVPLWDVYGFMGELGSSKTWYKNGLMQSDYVHFTSPGYHLKGAMLFDAFLKWMDQMEDYTEQKLTEN